MQTTEWENNPVVDIIQRMSKPPDRIQCLIEFLTILPEEVPKYINSNTLTP